MKKVLFVVHALTGGGAERAVSVWSSKLADNGYDVSVLTYAKADGEYDISSNVNRINISNSREDYLKLSYWDRYKAIRRNIKELSPDLIISFLRNAQTYVMLANIGLKSKRVETVRISPWHTKCGFLQKIIWKLCFLTGDLIVLQSNDQKPFFNKRLQKKCVVVPNTVDAKYEKAGKNEFSARIEKFVAAGRIDEQKNYPMMIAAFANAHENNPNIRLDIYGAGKEAYISKIQDVIKEHNAEEYIRLCGRTNDMHGVMMSSDAFLMSSDFEGMPNALIEAMTLGLVCISTDCQTGPRDLIKDGENGFLIPVGGTAELAQKINMIANLSGDEIKSLGEAARRDAIELCGEKNTLIRLIDAIESV